MRVLLVAAQRYNGHEFWVSMGILKQRGHTVDVASTKEVIADEITMQASRIKHLVGDIEFDHDALMFVSGNMKDTEAYWKDKRTLRYVELANEASKPIAAICCSVPSIRHAAEGKKVSFFPLNRSRELLIQEGAILQNVALTRDQNLVTAEHQMASQMWVSEFCNLMEDLPPEFTLTDSGYTPKGRERKPIPELERLKEHLKRS